MGTVQYRVEPNPLTKPASYKLRFMPKQTAGYDELAAAVAKDTGLSAEQAKAFLQSAVKNIKEMLCNGMQVTLEEALTCAPSLGARLVLLFRQQRKIILNYRKQSAENGSAVEYTSYMREALETIPSDNSEHIHRSASLFGDHS